MNFIKRFKKWKLPTKIGLTLSFLGLVVGLLSLFPLIKKNKTNSIEELILIANKNYDKNNFKEAIELYTKILELNPNEAICWKNKCKSYLAIEFKTTDISKILENCCPLEFNSFSKALYCIKKSIELNNFDKESYLYYGILMYYWGNLHPLFGPANDEQNAYSQFLKAITLSNKNMNYSIDKWNYETSCSYYGMALSMARIYLEMKRNNDNDSIYLFKADSLLKKAIITCPVCVNPQKTMEQIISKLSETIKLSRSAYVTPPY
ncbi:MAG: tetratricopeptide repeat protein [Candidatus Atribacteria bacterium]|nr:tetratricopeptide repeat protein [Candidatus Atribacteria bacterium]